MKYAKVKNLPKKPKEIFDEALKVCFNSWVDEKGTADHPSVWRGEPSKLSYEKAYDIIEKSKPLWRIIFRNISYISLKEPDYWEFGGCNIGKNDYGEVFIWIQVSLEEAEKIFEKYNLEIERF
jgi:hypothetical protein